MNEAPIPVPTRSPTEVREWLYEEGIRVTEWARTHGFKPAEVYALLSGKTRGRWGRSHEVALALGIKRRRVHQSSAAGPATTQEEPKELEMT